MKGIILAGGKGTRLFPLTKYISKQLLPIFDKPMIYYSLSVLLISGIKDILLISSKEDIILYQKLLGSGNHLGFKISYKIQEEPIGIAHSIKISEDFIKQDNVTLILGDNIFWGHGLGTILRSAQNDFKNGCTLFAYEVVNPNEYGVLKFDKNFNAIKIIEKPNEYISNWAVTGLYIYDNSVVDYVKDLKISSRGEYEITDLNNLYIQNNQFNIIKLGRGHAWLDTGTFQGLQNASSFVESIQDRQGLKIACIEEIAWRNGWIDDNELIEIANDYSTNDYGDYLKKIVNNQN